MAVKSALCSCFHCIVDMSRKRAHSPDVTTKLKKKTRSRVIPDFDGENDQTTGPSRSSDVVLKEHLLDIVGKYIRHSCVVTVATTNTIEV
ncbi:hypothetical protein BDW22DRAFT_1125977 [Trametopsis cervina]|nr:hypothetical protein BDW22DRAFT_1125977 [Trametopsis cervina]